MTETYGDEAKIAVAGYGEGGLISLYSAAIDTRIDSCLVSGYFGPRERVWEEPIYRNIWSLLRDFGDAEIAGMILPRRVVIEYSESPAVSGPPPPTGSQKRVAAPGKITTFTAEEVVSEFSRLETWDQQLSSGSSSASLVPEDPESSGVVSQGSDRALSQLLAPFTDAPVSFGNNNIFEDRRIDFDSRSRQKRQVREIERNIQHLLDISSNIRDEFFLDRVAYGSPKEFEEDARRYRKIFWEDVIGKIDGDLLPRNPRARIWRETELWTGYEVVLDVYPDVFAWGILLIPKNLKEGERRPVVVTQHGLEGVPEDVIRTDVQGFRAYQAFGDRLAAEGFIVFAPHNPYRGGDAFRVLQRKGNPLQLSLFSFIVDQHQQILDWLKGLAFVDPERIGFYGLSYGGKTAMRVPAILEDYALSICSGDFNEWIWKNVTVEWPNSYMFTGEYEMPEFALGITFNYAEMAYLIFPRPFMVERGHRDGVGLDEWVAHEFAKVRRVFDEHGLGHRTTIEYFNGVHEINGIGTYDFLKKHLRWPGVW